jgi:hypothetical protein
MTHVLNVSAIVWSLDGLPRFLDDNAFSRKGDGGLLMPAAG